MKQNIIWIDNLKFIGIIAVILGHIASPLGIFIFSWHMPLFFLIAGFFINYNISLNVFIVKNLKRLIVPYIVFSLIGIFATYIKNIVLHREQLELINELNGMIIWMDFPSLMNTYAFVLWFLPTLFFAKIFLYIIIKYIKNEFLGFLIVIILFVSSFYIDIPFAIDNAFNALIFLFIGNYIYRNQQYFNYWYLGLLVLLISFFIGGIPSLDIASKAYSLPFMNIIWSFSIILVLVSFLKKYHFSNSLFQQWSSNTMLLFIIHPYTNNIAHILTDKFNISTWYIELLLSLFLLEILLLIKIKYQKKGILKYV